MTHTQVIETASVRIEWRAPHPCRLRADALQPAEWLAHVDLAHEDDEANALLEETTYGLLVQARGDTASVEVRHDDPTVTHGLYAAADDRSVHGTIATRSQAGTLRLLVIADGRPDVTLAAEVLPTKVDRATVAQMRDDVEAVVVGLTVRYLRATRTAAAPVPDRTANAGGWLRLVEAALGALEPALADIARVPQRDLRRTITAARSDAIRKPDAAARRAVRTGQGGGRRAPLDIEGIAGGVPVADRLPTSRSTRTLDTSEHRWLRGTLDQALAHARELQSAERRARPKRRTAAHLAALDRASAQLRTLVRLEPLAAASRRSLPPPTLRLRRAHGYSAAYDAARLLRFGLALGAGRVQVSLIDLAVLYERWCALTVAQALADTLQQPIDPRVFFDAEPSGLTLRLRPGQPYAVRFRLDGGGLVRLDYQPRFGRPALLPQRPDLLLTVERTGRPTRHYVLDAKYRRDDAPGTVRRYGLPAPPPDALADLHRYRDAIRNADAQRIVDQAVALYPFAPDNPAVVEQSTLWTSIEKLGVGAIPLLPQTKQHLDAWLRRVLFE